MADALYCSNIDNLINYNDFDKTLDLWTSHDDNLNDIPVDPALYDGGFLIITPERFKAAVVAHGNDALTEIVNSIPVLVGKPNITVYIGEKGHTMSADRSVMDPIDPTGVFGDTFTEFVFSHDGVWTLGPTDPPVAFFVPRVGGVTYTGMELYSAAAVPGTATYSRQLLRSIAFDPSVYPNNLSLQDDDDYFAFYTAGFSNVHCSMNNNFYVGAGLIRAQALMDKYITPCLASPSSNWLPSGKTYSFPVGKTVASFVVDQNVGDGEDCLVIQCVMEGSDLYTLVGEPADGTIALGVQKIRVIPQPPPGHAYIWRPGNLTVVPASGTTQSDVIAGLFDPLNSDYARYFVYQQFHRGVGKSLEIPDAVFPITYRAIDDGFYNNLPTNDDTKNFSKTFYDGDEQVMVLGYNQVSEGYTTPSTPVFFQLDLVDLSDPGDAEFPPGTFVDDPEADQFVPLTPTGLIAALNRSANVTGVINRYIDSLTEQLPYYVDAENGVDLQVDLDANEQRITNVAEAEFLDDLVPMSQAKEILG